MEYLRALHLHQTPTYDLVSDALPIALTYTISAYDACYVALANKLGLPLVTADDALIRKLALHILRQDPAVHGGIAVKQQRAGWDQAYVLKILSLA